MTVGARGRDDDRLLISLLILLNQRSSGGRGESHSDGMETATAGPYKTRVLFTPEDTQRLTQSPLIIRVDTVITLRAFLAPSIVVV